MNEFLVYTSSCTTVFKCLEIGINLCQWILKRFEKSWKYFHKGCHMINDIFKLHGNYYQLGNAYMNIMGKCCGNWVIFIAYSHVYSPGKGFHGVKVYNFLSAGLFKYIYNLYADHFIVHWEDFSFYIPIFMMSIIRYFLFTWEYICYKQFTICKQWFLIIWPVLWHDFNML